jgi:hypothetical protein
MTACEHRLLRLWRTTPEGKVYCCSACGEAFAVTLTPLPAANRPMTANATAEANRKGTT